MIDLHLLRNNPQEISASIVAKDPSYNITMLLNLDQQLRLARIQVEELRYKKNELAKKAQSGITQDIREESIQVGRELKNKEQELENIEEQFKTLYFQCPNIPLDQVPIGDKSHNKVLYEVGKKPTFDFTVQDHVQLGAALDWFDFAAAAKIAGSNFALYKGQAVRLLYALAQLMIDHNQRLGYHLVLPPYLVNETSLMVSGNFPKFKDQVYQIEKDSLFLAPTSEVDLVNIYRDHIFEALELPVRLTSWTSCFRREAGGYGAAEKGLIRIHQFEKVELVVLSTPGQADNEYEKMLACAQELLKKLGLYYRVVLLASQDSSFQAAKTVDLEVWLPSKNGFMEVSSVSNCTDFQARRGSIRYRPDKTSKPELVYTLNGSSLALPRLMVALMETYQQPDGSIVFPDCLKSYGI